MDSPDQNTIIFIPGLSDGLLTVRYPRELTKRLPSTWSLVETLLSSSYGGWASSSVRQDATEIASCVAYFQRLRPGGMIVLTGHSTGCQDVMEYLTGQDRSHRPPVHGAIFQAPVSDREALSGKLPSEVYDEGVSMAKRMVDRREGDEMLPTRITKVFLGPYCTARRWLSLASPNHNGDEDFYSSDLTDDQLKKTFGSLPHSTRVCLLYSGSDQYVPDSVDKRALLKRWINIIKQGGAMVDEECSSVIDGATHNLQGDAQEVVDDLIGRVLRFLDNIVQL